MDSLEEKVEVELTVAEERTQFEKEKLSRRQALARIGFQAGAAAIAALTADELLRKVGKEMQRRAGDNKVAQQVAKELNNAGVANAIPAVLKPGDVGFVPLHCGFPYQGCLWNCRSSIAFICEPCTQLCVGAAVATPRPCDGSDVYNHWCYFKSAPKPH